MGSGGAVVYLVGCVVEGWLAVSASCISLVNPQKYIFLLSLICGFVRACVRACMCACVFLGWNILVHEGGGQ